MERCPTLPIMRDRSVLAALTVLPWLVFGQTWNFDFVWDDEANIINNAYLHGASFANLIQLWQAPYERLYVPLTYTAWWSTAALADGSRLGASAFHFSNVVIHILSTLTVFAILTTLTRHVGSACIGALLFALHPVQVEPVAWITGMKDVLSGFLSLLALWQYLKYALAKSGQGARAALKDGKGRPNRSATPISNRATYHFAAATAAFICAMLAKPSAIVTPVIALLLDRWIVGRSLRDSVRSLSVWFVAALPFVLITRSAQADSELDFITPLWARPLVAADALAFYLYKLFVPLWLSPDYGRLPELVLGGKWSHFTWLVPCAAGLLLYLGGKRVLWLTAGAAIFAVGIAPVAGLVPFNFQNTSTVADRYLYLSMLGPAVAVSWLVAQSNRGSVTVGGCVLVTFLGIASAVQARHWQNNGTLFSYAIQLNPGSWIAQYSLGRALAKNGHTDKAIVSFREAARLKPEFTNAHFSLGALLTSKGEYDEAIAAYRRSLAIAPQFVDARLGLINTLVLRGDLPAALGEFDQVLKIAPNRADIYFNLANLQTRTGNLAGAAQSLDQALRVKPDFAVAHNSLGRILAAQGYLAKATDHFRTAVQIDPAFAEAHESLALALMQQGKVDEARQHVRAVQQLRQSRDR